MTSHVRVAVATVALLVPLNSVAWGSVTVITGPPPATPNFVTPHGVWTPIEDPPQSGMHASVLTMDDGPAAALVSLGAVPSGTDIGYGSINGADIGSATTGFYFDPTHDFSVAIDFDVESIDSVGGGGIGFGIGEDTGGANSAGVALAILNGAPVLFTSAARVGDTTQAPESLVSGFGRGRMFVSYEAVSGDVTVGVNATPGATDPGVLTMITAIQDQWNDEPLLVSFFLRSQAVSPFPALSNGSLGAVFSNFEVLSGSPISLSVPEPSAALLAGLGFAGCLSRRR